ncbi:hypothetical protein AK812_SmicGene14874 [Symbiodinium microadriaticum]|uniref:Uncharacterized protein n=1 Tax=Symbiodinium microadriaticum TaxID=2951 RepID=A0A1Q9E4E3_SYMMI|nr:hypothetical protein AK812_SmicGene14874 [Symbiodinium microadriaticum]
MTAEEEEEEEEELISAEEYGRSPTSSESHYAFLQGDLGCLANLEKDFGLLRGCRNEFHEQLAWPSAMPFGMEGVVFTPSKATATVKAILQRTVPGIPGS